MSKKVSLLSLTSWVKVTSPCGDSLNYVTRFGEEFFTECITFIKHPFIPSSVDLWANERSTLWSQLLLKCFQFKDVLSTIPNFLSRTFTTIWQTDVSVEIRKHHFNSLYSNIFLVCLSGWSAYYWSTLKYSQRSLNYGKYFVADKYLKGKDMKLLKRNET